MFAIFMKSVLAWKSLKVSPLRVLLLTAALGSTPLLPPLAHAQGGSISGQVVQPASPIGTGGPASSPLIYVCPSTASGNPCPATVSLYSAPQLGACSPSCAVSNPYTGDQYGNYSLFAATGVYLVQVVPVTGVTYQYLVMAVGGTVTSITISPPALLFTSSGCGPITTTGTCTFNLASQAANQIFASPNGGSGAPFFRNIVGPDFGSLVTSTWVLGNCTGATTSPSFCALTANMIPSTLNATTFSGNVQVNGTLGVSGITTLSSTLGVAGNATVGGTLSVTGSTTLSSTLSVTGSTTLTGGATSPTFNATSGFLYNSTAPLNHVLLGNGSEYIDSASIPYSVISGTGSGTPTFIGGSGGGSSAPTPTCGTSACIDRGGVVTVTASSTPSTNGEIAAIVFNGTYNGSMCSIWPNSYTTSNDAAEPKIYIVPSSTSLVISSGSVALTGSTTYAWAYLCNFR